MGDRIAIGIIGDYDEARPSHRATNEALGHAIFKTGLEASAQWAPTESLAGDPARELSQYDGLWCSPGIPYKSMAGALNGIRYARENNIPFLGTCGGFQHTVMEYARNVLGLRDAGHAEIDPGAACHVITALSCSLAGEPHCIDIKPGTRTHAIYQRNVTQELFTCKYGLNPDYLQQLDESGFTAAGKGENGEARILELDGHRFFIATLFQPQLTSTPEKPHVLITAYLEAAREYHRLRRT